MRIVTLTRKFLLLRTKIFTTYTRRNNNTFLLRRATVTRAIRPNNRIRRQSKLTTTNRRHPTRRLTRSTYLTNLTSRGNAHRPLGKLLSTQRISTRRRLQPHFNKNTRPFRHLNITRTVALNAMRVNVQVRNTRRLFRLFLRLIRMILQLGSNRVTTLDINRSTKRRNSKILNLPRQPISLVMLYTRHINLHKRIRILSPNARRIRLPFLQPRRHNMIQQRQRNTRHRSLTSHRPKSSHPLRRFHNYLTFLINTIKRYRTRRLYLQTRARRPLNQFYPTNHHRFVMTIRSRMVQLT